jgi:beta-lactamase regulating signal transducer with metallopeptidase domain
MFAADLPPLADVVVKVTVLLAVAALASRVLSRRSAAARHQIWAVAIVASLLMPALALISPQWTIAVLPAPPAAAAITEIAPVTTPAVASTADPVFEPIPAVTPDPGPDTSAVRQTTRLSTITSIWLAGMLLVLMRVAFGTARVWWIARRATPADTWASLGDDLAWTLGIDRRVTFLSGEVDAMPMAWGLLRARVLLPAEAESWPIERQRVVLLHELAHVKRRDCLTQMFAQLACAVYWFNPMVWHAAARLRAERERACDDLVLAAGTRGSDYADHLLDIARSLRSGAWPTWSAVTMAHRSQLEGRLMAILDPALPRRSPTRRSVAAFAAVALISIVSLAGARVVAKAAEAAAQGRPSAPAAPEPAPAPMPAPTPMPTPIAAPPPAPMPAPRAPRIAAIVPPAPVPPAPVQVPPVPMPAPVVVAPLPPMRPEPGFALGIEQSITAAERALNRAFAEMQQGTQGRQVTRATPADPKITAALTAALKDEDQEVRQQALHTLVRMGATLPPDVISSMLKDKSSDVRQQAIFALGRQRDPKNVNLLLEALKDSDADVRQHAVSALSQLRDSRAVDPLIVALKDTDPDVRQQAAHALGQLRDARAVDALIAALKDSNAEVRQNAVFALGQIR